MISCFTPSCVPTDSYVFCLIMKKLPKKYAVFFEGSFTRMAENLVCRNVEIIGSVILVQKSIVRIFGIADNASKLKESKCDTAREITFCECLVSASVNNNSSPVAFLYPSIHAQFLPIHPSGFICAFTGIILEFFFAYSEMILPVVSSDESSITMIS